MVLPTYICWQQVSSTQLLVTTIVLYTTGILAQCPAGFDVVQILCRVCSHCVVQPPLESCVSGLERLRRLTEYTLGRH